MAEITDPKPNPNAGPIIPDGYTQKVIEEWARDKALGVLVPGLANKQTPALLPSL